MAYDPEASFNNGKHVLSNDYDRLQESLVPMSGKCNSLEGEMLRASSRIYHDYFCNGFGNNWTGAYNFLDEHFGLLANERKLLKRYASGKIAGTTRSQYTVDDKIACALEAIGERVVLHVLRVEKTGLTENTIDMFDYQTRDGW